MEDSSGCWITRWLGPTPELLMSVWFSRFGIGPSPYLYLSLILSCLQNTALHPVLTPSLLGWHRRRPCPEDISYLSRQYWSEKKLRQKPQEWPQEPRTSWGHWCCTVRTAHQSLCDLSKAGSMAPAGGVSRAGAGLLCTCDVAMSQQLAVLTQAGVPILSPCNMCGILPFKSIIEKSRRVFICAPHLHLCFFLAL